MPVDVKFDCFQPMPSVNGPVEQVVKYLREFSQLSVDALAYRASVSPVELQMFEAGTYQFPVATLERLSVVLRTATHIRCVEFRRERRERMLQCAKLPSAASKAAVKAWETRRAIQQGKVPPVSEEERRARRAESTRRYRQRQIVLAELAREAAQASCASP